MIVLTVRTARQEALRTFERGVSAKKANATFLALMDQGFAAVEGMVATAARGSPARGRAGRPADRTRPPGR
jgi:hypothetical protein